MNLTNITRDIGKTIARLKENNKLIEELNQQYANPTFVEILEDVKETNGILAAMLMLWYDQKYNAVSLTQTADINKMIDYLKNKKPKEKKSSRIEYVDDGCGSPYGGGCGIYSSSGGCGSPYSGGC